MTEYDHDIIVTVLWPNKHDNKTKASCDYLRIDMYSNSKIEPFYDYYAKSLCYVYIMCSTIVRTTIVF